MFKQKILSEIATDVRLSAEKIEQIINLDCFSIARQSGDISFFSNLALNRWLAFDNFAIFGTGGSNLCGQCLHSLAQNLGVCKKNIAFIDNLDPCSLKIAFSKIDPQNTGFLFISKSGETLETITQLLLVMEKFTPQKNSSQFLESHFAMITENKNSTMRNIAAQNHMIFLEHPQNIGGRFSALSIVGMLPAILSGLDPKKIRFGARDFLDHHIDEVKNGVAFIIDNMNGSYNDPSVSLESSGLSTYSKIQSVFGGIVNRPIQHVSFFYSDKLRLFGKWLAQLYAESTGKSRLGVTPITAIGSVDQHSQLQLYLEGPTDKCFTFFCENQKSDLEIPSKNLPEAFGFLRNKKVSEIFSAQCEATIESIAEKNYWARNGVRRFDFETITEETMGALFAYFMLEVIFVCEIMAVDPFDQPAVEEVKITTKEILKKNDH